MKKTYIAIGVFIVLVVGGIATTRWADARPSPLDGFAQCLTEKGAIFYGAFWCPHCQAQKKMFGRAARLLPYVECSTPDGKAQLPLCTDKKVEGYPTWEFADGSRLSGEVPLKTLAEKTLCSLPQ